VVLVLKYTSQGEELLISYGDIPPSAFIFKYGCLPEQLLAPSVTMDRVLMWVPPSFAPAGVDADRASALSNNGYPATAAEVCVRNPAAMYLRSCAR
jgi:hypothetical protein